MEVWNGRLLVWNEIWNGRLLVWNGNGMDMEWTKIASMEYGKIVFHSILSNALSTTQVI